VDTKDYYKTLGVPRDADADAIKKAYRKLARLHHPDANKGDKRSEERFKEVNEAHEVLSDPEKRKLYDRLGPNYKQFTQGGGPPPGRGEGSPFGSGRARSAPGTSPPGNGTRLDDLEFDDLFGMFSGGAGGAQNIRKPRDFEQAVEITVEEAFHGATRVLQKAGQPDIEVTIPKGARTGTKVRVKGQGGRNARGQYGDLYLIIEIKPHAVYEIRGDDLYRETTIPAFTAMIGGEAQIETLAGQIIVHIPAGATSGKLVRLRNRGMPKLNSDSFGDMYLRLSISIPNDLTDAERDQLLVMARRRGLAPK
jgi:curved DNA-binding protein